MAKILFTLMNSAYLLLPALALGLPVLAGFPAAAMDPVQAFPAHAERPACTVVNLPEMRRVMWRCAPDHHVTLDRDGAGLSVRLTEPGGRLDLRSAGMPAPQEEPALRLFMDDMAACLASATCEHPQTGTLPLAGAIMTGWPDGYAPVATLSLVPAGTAAGAAGGLFPPGAGAATHILHVFDLGACRWAGLVPLPPGPFARTETAIPEMAVISMTTEGTPCPR